MEQAVVELPMISNSKAKTFRRCPKQYEFKYVMGLKPKRRKVQLERGSWMHELLMVDADGEDWTVRHAQLTEQFYGLFEEEREDLGDLPAECERLMTSYKAHYSKLDRQETTVDTELDEVLTLPNGLRFRFIIDRIYEDAHGRLWLKDYKTVKKFMPDDFMLLDAQLSRYFWCAEYMGYKPIAGVEFDEIITLPPTLPKELASGHLERRKNLRCDVYTYYLELKQRGLHTDARYLPMLRTLAARHDRWYRRTQLPRSKVMTTRMMNELIWTAQDIEQAEERGKFPRTPMKDCTWDCDYLEPCTVQLQGGDIKQILRDRYVRNRRDD
jgi:hypothetical protein